MNKLATPVLMVLLAVVSILLSGCATAPTDADCSTGQAAEALQKAAPVIDCAFTPRNLRFAECGD